MKLIQLTRGKVAKVDDEDYVAVSKHTWCVHEDTTIDKWYADTRFYLGGGKQRVIKMHRFILGLLDSTEMIDHIDGDGLNNQKHNLRIATYSQNGANRRCKRTKLIPYLGVHLVKAITSAKRYRAEVRKNGINHCVLCTSIEEAALEYNIMAIKYHGEFARLNVIDWSTHAFKKHAAFFDDG